MGIIFQYIPLDYILIVLGLAVVGEMFKKFTTLPNYFLTTALPVLGAAVMGVIYGTSAEVLVVADLIKQICIGLLMGWAATGGYEFIKNNFVISKTEKLAAKKTLVATTLVEPETVEYEIEESTDENSEETK